MTSQYTPTVAIASQLAPSHAPILSPGVITYDNFKVFEKMCHDSFPTNPSPPTSKNGYLLYWEDDILMRVIRMQDNRPFWPWVIDIKKCNLLLVGKPLHVAVGTMKAHLTQRFDPPLRAVYRSADTSRLWRL
ncbi:hypothetical protein Hypma_011475 [Hypsizygus marmoreus]|uniref:Uncharacterized protein n=1 Tax=Hypsizygus marmoreus TaxID=39966 RepID=A0A369JPH2_HYPMA|nr:hypothetical protein Hypma_011475 [Hypsizygus marmoreus]